MPFKPFDTDFAKPQNLAATCGAPLLEPKEKLSLEKGLEIGRCHAVSLRKTGVKQALRAPRHVHGIQRRLKVSKDPKPRFRRQGAQGLLVLNSSP